YPHSVLSLQAVDPAVLLPARVAERGAAVPFPIQVHYVKAETLPLEDHSVDSVVSTWTLCSIVDPITALCEIRRVLKPTGCFFFLEHGRSDEKKIAVWQDRLNPLQRLLAGGCNLNRRIDQLIMQAGLTMTKFERFRVDRLPRIVGEMYRGAAVSPTQSESRS
ncbi:MAG TPA: class I SAM-dependent methyltransferase, partial [Nitrospiraceae bacterium]